MPITMSRNDNILDEVEKNIGPRTCPECGYQFSLLLFLKRYILKHGFSKWTCPNCNKFIKYNYTKANIIMVIVFFVCVFSFLGLQSKFGWDFPNYAFIIPYFIFAIILLNFDRLEKYK